jgi:hypothetical protein
VSMQASPRWLKTVNGETPHGAVIPSSIVHDPSLREPRDSVYSPWAQLFLSEVTPLRVELSSRGEGELIVRADSVEVRGILTNGTTERFIARGPRIQFTRDTLGAMMIRAASVRLEP